MSDKTDCSQMKLELHRLSTQIAELEQMIAKGEFTTVDINWHNRHNIGPWQSHEATLRQSIHGAARGTERR